MKQFLTLIPMFMHCCLCETLSNTLLKWVGVHLAMSDLPLVNVSNQVRGQVCSKGAYSYIKVWPEHRKSSRLNLKRSEAHLFEVIYLCFTMVPIHLGIMHNFAPGSVAVPGWLCTNAQ